jgi:predicted MFS family arabinose efflux permease
MWALIVAEGVSSTGSAMSFLALPWFVLATTGSAERMTTTLAAELVPMALFGIPSGALVGRLGARNTMLASDALRAPLIALVPILSWSGHLTYAGLLAIVFATGLFTAPYVAAQRSIIPELFGDDERTVAKASTLFSSASQLPIVLGPSLAGALIAAFGARPILVVDAATYLFALVTVLALVRAGRRVAVEEDARGLLAGVKYLFRDRLLGPMALTVIVLDGAGGAIAVALPLLAFTRYHQNAHVAGLLFTTLGVGAVVGSVVTSKLLDRFSPLRLASSGIVLLALPLWFIAAPIAWPLACASVFATGFFIPFVNGPTMGLLSSRPPAALRAKVLTAVLTMSGLGGPLGRLVVGPAFRSWGNGGVWIVSAGAMSVGALLYVAAAFHGRNVEAPQAVATTA